MKYKGKQSQQKLYDQKDVEIGRKPEFEQVITTLLPKKL